MKFDFKLSGLRNRNNCNNISGEKALQLNRSDEVVCCFWMTSSGLNVNRCEHHRNRDVLEAVEIPDCAWLSRKGTAQLWIQRSSSREMFVTAVSDQ